MSQEGGLETVSQDAEALEQQHWGVPLFKRECPRCESGKVHRSHRRSSLERVLALFLLPYRCEFCNFRFFLLRWAGDWSRGPQTN